MGLTISIAGILSIILREKGFSKFESKSYILEIIGGILILLLGVFLLTSFK